MWWWDVLRAGSRERWAVRLSAVGEARTALLYADQAVAARRRSADRRPAALAKALVVRAGCLQARGRQAEADRDVAEALPLTVDPGTPAAARTVAITASLLNDMGRTDEATTLADRLAATLPASATLLQNGPVPGRRAPTPAAAYQADLKAVRVAETRVGSLRHSGDSRELGRAWGELARARWQAGSRRNEALRAAREALAETRRWSQVDPDAAREDLIVHLRLFAEYAAAIGLGSDSREAAAEADRLARVPGR
ncbi:hypothetical protein [Actinoplanes sp. NBRC 101535]|uniref:hypothetical protein n=1 Tax=Actinoplanes sp. NBRC 101535 TaxID=3032196 RepID=UPI0025561CD7|nr:hypothetical protein [Actinoplanes sp. NBRC 101535]